MSDKAKLNAAPLLYVLMDDGSEYEVQTWNPDMVAWDRARAQHKWPGPDEAAWQWMTYLAWHTLTREGTIPKIGLNEFTAATRIVSPIDDKDAPAGGEAGPMVDPTQPDLEPD